MTRIILSLIAFAGCLVCAFIAKKYNTSFVLFSMAMFWVAGGNIALFNFPYLSSDHVFRWSPFYVLMIAGSLTAIIETFIRWQKRK